MEIKIGKNFDESPLTFQEFIAKGRHEFSLVYSNFFYNFYNYEPGEGRNYERLKQVNKKLAEELSNVYEKFHLSKFQGTSIHEENLKGYALIEGHSYPKEILEKGYKAYLILRKKFKDDPELLEDINNYNRNKERKAPDDTSAFFV